MHVELEQQEELEVSALHAHQVAMHLIPILVRASFVLLVVLLLVHQIRTAPPASQVRFLMQMVLLVTPALKVLIVYLLDPVI